MKNCLIQNSFNYTVKLLQFIVLKLKIPYKVVNILIWYILLPTFWLSLVNLILAIVYVIFWLLITCRSDFYKQCDKLFYKSQKFILFFGDYFLWSVIICLLLPLIITIILLSVL